jgi:hypothetical protein
MGQYVSEENGYFGIVTELKGKKVSFSPLGRCVYINDITEVHETNDVLLNLEFDYNGRAVHIMLPRGDLKKNILLDYAKKGMDVFEHTANALIEYIQLQEEKIIPMTGHKYIGWDSYFDENGEKKPFLKGYKGIGYESVYLGDLKIKPTGQKKDYQDFISEHILGTPLQLAVAVGLSSVLVGFIGPEVDCDNLFVHVFGDTSTGKTTFGLVAVAMGSKPEFKGQTLARRYNGTENALLQAMVGNTGLPVCLDEAKSAKIRDFSSFIYSLESGTEKMRLDRDASVRSVGEYHTSIVSTGEFSLSDNSERATGKELRVHQFGNIAWTRNAEESETIKAFFRKNYGLPCVLLAKYLLEIGQDTAIECFNRNRQKFIDSSKVKDTFTERLSIKYGMILATVKLANEAIGMELSYKTILEMLIQNEMETAATHNIGQIAYDYVLGQINIHADHFSSLTPNCFNAAPELDAPKYTDVWGVRVRHNPPKKIKKKECLMTIYVQKDKLEDILREGHFKDVSVIIKKWKDCNLLDHEGDRNTRYRKITPVGTQVHVYGIRVFNNSQNDPVKSKAKR